MYDPELYPDLDDLCFDFPGPIPAQSVPFLPTVATRYNSRLPAHLNHHQVQTVRDPTFLVLFIVATL